MRTALRHPFVVLLSLVVSWTFVVPTFAQDAPSSENIVFEPALFDSLEFRMVGPFRGGRSTAVTGIAEEPHTFFMGTTGGGVWKSTNAGQTWVNTSDGFFEVGAIGSIDIADADENVIYVGTGSACTRGNISTGRGVYKSTDGGKTWTFAGLREAGQIGRIAIHPRDPDLVYLAALGHALRAEATRGVGAGFGELEMTCQCSGAWTVNWNVPLRSGCSNTANTRRVSATSNWL